ncbi:unnamed protein product, partial [Owenia fusiformis]
GPSCEECGNGCRRSTINGSSYETCKPCECNNHGETSPAECLPDSGICTNCCNGTVGDFCENPAPNVVLADQCEAISCQLEYWGLSKDGCQRKFFLFFFYF